VRVQAVCRGFGLLRALPKTRLFVVYLKHHTIGCPIFATVLSSLRWAIVRSTIRLSSSEPEYADWATFVQKVVMVTRPAPVFRFLDETSSNWIAVHVLQLLHSFVVGKDIEVVVAGLPEGSRSEAFGDGEFEGLQGL
jgi:hypothetical protein